MSLYFVYRINGGQVQTASVDSQSNLGTYFSQAVDPSTPDGVNLAVPKIFSAGVVRNATAPEISNFTTAASQDNALVARALHAAFLDAGLSGIVYKATAQVIIDELNVLRQWITAFKAATAASSNLANFQTRVAALASTPDRTYTQGKNAIKDAINSGAND